MPDTPTTERPASLRAGRYRIESLLGEGSRGETYLAVDAAQQKRV